MTGVGYTSCELLVVSRKKACQTRKNGGEGSQNVLRAHLIHQKKTIPGA